MRQPIERIFVDHFDLPVNLDLGHPSKNQGL